MLNVSQGIFLPLNSFSVPGTKCDQVAKSPADVGAPPGDGAARPQKGAITYTEVRDAVAHMQACGESPGEATVFHLRISWPQPWIGSGIAVYRTIFTVV